MKDNMQKVTVLTAFRDKDNFSKVYSAGSVVEFTKERAEHLKRLGLVGFDDDATDDVTGDDVNDDDVTDDVAIDLEANHQKIVSAVKKNESLDELGKALIAEINAKNRASVVGALQARIAELQSENANNELPDVK